MAADQNTPLPRRPAASNDPTTPTLIAGDALILALAAAYREADAASTAFDREEIRHNGKLETYLKRGRDAHAARRDTIADAICMIPASGLPGAMVQAETLFLDVEGGNVGFDDYRQSREAALRTSALQSIFRVLARETGRTCVDGIDVLYAHKDEHRADVQTLMSEWTDFFREEALL